MPRTRAATVAQYIADAPKPAQRHLRAIRALLRTVAPKATEAIKWGHPVLEAERILFSFSAHRSHLNFMPTASSLAPFKEELAAFKTGKDTVQLPYDRPLPKALLTRIAKHRAAQVKKGAKWMG